MGNGETDHITWRLSCRHFL